MVGDVTMDWAMPDGSLCVMPSRNGIVAAFPEPGERNFRLVVVVPKARPGSRCTYPTTLSTLPFPLCMPGRAVSAVIWRARVAVAWSCRH